MPALRCPYCHSRLFGEPIRRCGECGTQAHIGCLREHGGCPIMGCGPRTRAVPLPGRLSWEELVEEASPWLELGASVAWEAATLPWSTGPWESPSWSLDDEPTSGSGSASSSRAA